MLLASCRSQKSINESQVIVNPWQTDELGGVSSIGVNAIVNTVGSWNTLQAGGTITLRGKKSFSSAVQIRMKRDEFIYISLRPLLGIEVGRLVITGDKLIVIDKINSRYIEENISHITSGIPATVSTVQDVLLGRPFVLAQGTLNISRAALMELNPSDNGLLRLTPVTQPAFFSYGFNYSDRGTIVSADVKPVLSNKPPYTVEYDNVHTTVAGLVAGALRVETGSGDKQTSVGIEYNSMKWNADISADTRIPSGYRRIEGKDILSLLTK